MEGLVYGNIEIAPVDVVKRAASDFGGALTETPAFKAFEGAAQRFRDDPTVQEAMGAYQKEQMALRPMVMLNALGDEEKAKLEALRIAFVSQPVAEEYFAAQAELISLCQALGDALSEATGLNYAAACGSSCCG